MNIPAANQYEQLLREVATASVGAIADRKVDVAINVYGKPYNTAATIYSLLQYSGQWIDKIYFITERRQPHNSSFDFITRALGHRVITYTPRLWLWVRPFTAPWLFRFRPFRLSVRYQYAWENTNKDYLFIMHNDVLYTSDILGAMLQQIGTNAGIGQVGQCWNCSAAFAGLCSPDTYTSFRPDYEELQQLLQHHPGSRAKDYGRLPRKDAPWPLPECRLNEWAALINMKVARNITMPLGRALPFGAFYELDIATRWFSDVLNMGHKVAHFSLDGYARHAWASSNANGHSALLNVEEYIYSENMAEQYLQNEIKKNM